MKRLLSLIMACLLCFCSLTGCGAEADEESVPSSDTKTEAIDQEQPSDSPTEIPPAAQDTLVNWEDAYSKVLTETMEEFPNYRYACSYTLFDVDKDGIPELLLKAGTCEADFEYRLFQHDPNLSVAMCFQTTSGSHTYPCGLGTEQAFLLVAGHMGVETVTKASYDGTSYTEEVLFHGEVQEYHDFTYLFTYELDDATGLQWTENPVDTNQLILDMLNSSTGSEDIEEPASIEILSVEYTGDLMFPLHITYKINNIKTVRGCVYLSCDAHAYSTQMFFYDENHVNEYKADGIYEYDVGWMGQGATNYFNIYYGYGTFDPYSGWTNGCSLKMYYRLTDDHGTISSEAIPDSEIHHLYSGNVEVGAWTLHESGDLIEINGASNSIPFSRINAFISNAGYTVFVELIDGVPHFTVDGTYIGAPRSAPIELGTGSLLYEIDTDNGTYTINRSLNDENISVAVMGNLPEALEGTYYPK